MTLSIAHWVGFITLTGIVARNRILMISHDQHLMREEGEPSGPDMIVRGSLERLAPVLMAALTAGTGLVPLVLGAGQTGKELLLWLAVVVLGGLFSSTLLDQVVTPALFLKSGRPVVPVADDGFQSSLDDGPVRTSPPETGASNDTDAPRIDAPDTNSQ